MTKQKKLLVLAMDGSGHTFRWIKQLADSDWQVHFYASHSLGTPSEWHSLPFVHVHRPKNVRLRALYELLSFPQFYWKLFRRIPFREFLIHWTDYTGERSKQDLQRLVQTLQPDIVHTLHTQTSAYLYDEIQKKIPKPKPLWMHSLWGSDLYFCSWFHYHIAKIRSVLRSVDSLVVEGFRDAELAKKLGFEGQILGPLPAFGGFDYFWSEEEIFIPPSKRKAIVVKGYQDAVGRLFTALKALELNSDLLSEYTIYALGAKDEGAVANVDMLRARNNIRIYPMQHLNSAEVLKVFKSSRISISLSISDGLPATFIEAFASGTFPIHSKDSVSPEWCPPGGAAFVDAQDPLEVARALRDALLDDTAVDRAAEINKSFLREKLSPTVIRMQSINSYNQAFRNGRAPK
jgi:glycosyltransferase involved in cell wall biosynthesis